MEEVLKGMEGVSNGSSWKKGEGEISEEKREGRRNWGILREREREREREKRESIENIWGNEI